MRRSLSLRCVLLGLLILLHIQQPHGFLISSGKKGDECRKTVMRMTKEYLKRFSLCIREAEATTKGNEEEFKKQLGCIVKCSLRKDDLLDEGGKVTEERLEKFAEKYLPSEIRGFTGPMMAGCLEEWVPQMDNEDPLCSKGYIDYMTCTQELVTNMC